MEAFLLDAELVTKEELEAAKAKAQKAGERLADVLLGEHLLSEEELTKLQAYILGIPYVNLEKETVPPEVLSTIPEPIARKHNIVAYRKKGEALEVAMLDPEDLQTIEFIKKKARLKILPRLTSSNSIKQLLKQYQKSLEAEFGEIIKEEAKGITPLASSRVAPEEAAGEDLKKMAEDLPIIRIVDTLLKHAILQNASDIHIEPMEKEVIVRYRIDGILHDAMTLPKQVEAGIVARVKVLANLKIDEHRLPQDGRFKIETEGEQISFRVSILPVAEGEKVVMRLLVENTQGYTLEGLGLRGESLEQIHQNLKRPVGMLLVTGPTGSGKTTTLYTMIDIVNVPAVNISTVEDPIEYRIPRVNQTQVKPQIGLTFASGLRALVRQDPDIIMVGEIRDNETAGLAVNAALTGHLVLSTLHTNSAAGAFPRLLDMKVEPFLIASTVNVVLAQRLVRKLCEPKEEYRLTKEEVANFAKEIDMAAMLELLKNEKVAPASATWAQVPFFRPKASEECPEGYKGRIGIFEVLEVTEATKAFLMKNATSEEIEKEARKNGMRTMLEDGFLKAAQGITTLEEVFRVTQE